MEKNHLQPKWFFYIALALWVGVVLWNLFYERVLGGYSGNSLLLVNLVLPWAIVMVFGFGSYLRERDWWWIMPLLAVMFLAGLYLELILLRALPTAKLWNLDWLLEAAWLTIYASPLALVPAGVFMLWPRDTAYERVLEPTCSECGYSLRGSAHSNQCPECGHRLIAGVDYPLPTVVREPADENDVSPAQETKE